MADNIKQLAQDSFHESISRGVVLVDFYADWCGPCRMMTPVLEQVAKDVSASAIVAKLDIDQAQQIATKFQVTSVPTLVLFKDGKEVGRLVGLRDADTIKEFIASANQ